MNAAEVVQELFTAVRRGHVEEVARLLDADPHLMEARDEEEDGTPLVVAAEHGHAGVVRLLLKGGADVNASDYSDVTALQYAAEGGHEEVVPVLLSHGADINRKGFYGSTALIRASYHGHLNIVRQLLQHTAGCGLDEKDDLGRTALRWACGLGHVEVARYLLLAGTDHTIADTDGETPRQAAEPSGNSACVPLLEVSGPLY
jgi:serine/threonine-protein phosphatase 6 regulatory ankyrin repeat subunit B